MPLTLQESDCFLTDVETQFRWYLEHADVEVARRYRKAVQPELRSEKRVALQRGLWA